MSEIIDDLSRSTTYHDFLELLCYLEKQPIKKTKGGAISRKDIYALMDRLECIKKVKIVEDKYGAKIHSEYQIRDLELLRRLGMVTYTTYHRRDEMLISKNDFDYIETFRPTKLGIYIFCEELEHPLYSNPKPIRNIWAK